jgi:hypothetical protein
MRTRTRSERDGFDRTGCWFRRETKKAIRRGECSTSMIPNGWSGIRSVIFVLVVYSGHGVIGNLQQIKNSSHHAFSQTCHIQGQITGASAALGILLQWYTLFVQ